MSEFFRELEDDIKQDRFNSLVKKVLPIIIVIILAIIISISSFVERWSMWIFLFVFFARFVIFFVQKIAAVLSLIFE